MTTYDVAVHRPTNAIVAVIVAAYLGIVIWQGNLAALTDAAKQDFLGGNNEQPFWRWMVALVVLLWLAQNPKTNFLFGPLLAFALVGMLINSAQKGSLTNLTNSLKSFFGQ